MTATEIITQHIPVLRYTDTVDQALAWMEEQQVAQLPLCDEGKYIGLVHAADLRQMPDNEGNIASLMPLVEKVSLPPHGFFLQALQLMQLRNISLVPVVHDSGQLLGVITPQNMLMSLANYTAAGEPGGIILLRMRPLNLIISEIGRIIESCDARMLHLNSWTDTTGQLLVAIKVNKTDIIDLVASFERYEYEVLNYFGENLSADAMKSNYEHLMNYLNI